MTVVACIQMASGPNLGANLLEAERLIEEAVSQQARLVVLPENFALMGKTERDKVELREKPGSGAIQTFLAEQAARHGIWLVGGTVPLVADDANKVRAACLVYDDKGKLAGRYDKIHLFDVDVPGRAAERYRESDTTLAGTRVVAAATPIGRIGMTVCYDIRFPALFHRLSVLGTDVLVVPAAFTVPTGQVHWQPLLQARAIESLVYVVAAGQWGEHAGGRKTYGHSMVIGPWGEIQGELPEGTGVVCVDLDMARLAELRQRFPTVQHRREL